MAGEVMRAWQWVMVTLMAGAGVAWLLVALLDAESDMPLSPIAHAPQQRYTDIEPIATPVATFPVATLPTVPLSFREPCVAWGGALTEHGCPPECPMYGVPSKCNYPHAQIVAVRGGAFLGTTQPDSP